MLSIMSALTWVNIDRDANQRRAILMGVVRHEVNKSAGNSGFMGSTWIFFEKRTRIQVTVVEKKVTISRKNKQHEEKNRDREGERG
jgi:hypothetical protein